MLLSPLSGQPGKNKGAEICSGILCSAQNAAVRAALTGIVLSIRNENSKPSRQCRIQSKIAVPMPEYIWQVDATAKRYLGAAVGMLSRAAWGRDIVRLFSVDLFEEVHAVVHLLKQVHHLCYRSLIFSGQKFFPLKHHYRLAPANGIDGAADDFAVGSLSVDLEERYIIQRITIQRPRRSGKDPGSVLSKRVCAKVRSLQAVKILS